MGASARRGSEYNRDTAHHDGATPALAEDVDAETRGFFQSIGKVSGTVFLEFQGSMLVLAEEEFGNVLRVLRGEAFEPLEFQFDELTADFHLWRAAGGKDQVADVIARLQHGTNELRDAERTLLLRQLRVGGHGYCDLRLV